MCQDIGHISGNVDSGGERNLFIAVATNGYFPARNVEVKEPLELWLSGRNSQM
jgi:hypothetical protein